MFCGERPLTSDVGKHRGLIQDGGRRSRDLGWETADHGVGKKGLRAQINEDTGHDNELVLMGFVLHGLALNPSQGEFFLDEINEAFLPHRLFFFFPVAASKPFLTP